MRFRPPAGMALGGLLVLVMLVLAGFWSVDSVRQQARRRDAAIATEVQALALVPAPELVAVIQQKLSASEDEGYLFGLFGAGGNRFAGNIAALPRGISTGGSVGSTVIRLTHHRSGDVEARVAADIGPDGMVVVVGRLGQGLTPARLAASLLSLELAALGALVLGAVLVPQVWRACATPAGRRRIPSAPWPARDGGFQLDILRAIAHDLRAPLARVRLILARGLQDATRLSDLQRAAEKAVNGLDRAIAIVATLLRLPELDADHDPDDFPALELTGLVREVVEFYEPLAGERRIRLDLEIAGTAAVKADRELMFEVLANLIDNAVKFTPAHGEVRIWAGRQGRSCVVRIADAGPGLDPARRDALLRMVAGRGPEPGITALGLGLSIVAAILRLHGFLIGFGAGPGLTVEIICPAMTDAAVP